MDEKREMLRHTLATLAYRGGKVVRDVPENFAGFQAGTTTRTPLQILAHIGDLMEWGLGLARGERKWSDSKGESWAVDTERFFATLQAFDAFLASDAELAVDVEQLFQGPVADALSHVGQIAILRRMFDAPIRGENYFVAKIEKGRVGPEQLAAVREFD